MCFVVFFGEEQTIREGQKVNRYLIIGSGIAGTSAAEAIRGHDPEAEITMVSAEKQLCINRPMLVDDLATDGSGNSLFEKQKDWPEQFGVDMIQGVHAEAINRGDKTVQLTDGRIYGYDKLIYSLGADARSPEIPGIDGSNVFTLRTREDAGDIRKAMKVAERAVVIGGGMLGLEIAWALCEEKLDVVVLEQSRRVAFGQIDQSAGNLMKKRIERFGVSVYTEAEVVEVGDGYVTFEEKIKGNECNDPCHAADAGNCGASCCGGCTELEYVTVPADMIILSTGVSPNSKLGSDAGLETVSRTNSSWISVDQWCRTSDPNIFAAGDAAAVNGRNDAIWDEARRMGKVAGINAVADMMQDDESNTRGETGEGKNIERPVYEPVIAEHVFKGFDTEVFTLADSSGAGTDGVYIRHADVEIFDYQRERYIRVSLQDGLIAGVLLINASELAPDFLEAYDASAGENDARDLILKWKESHDVDFKPAAPFRKR